jgi:membrane protein implicated in regulation of membrane protease activity
MKTQEQREKDSVDIFAALLLGAAVAIAGGGALWVVDGAADLPNPALQVATVVIVAAAAAAGVRSLLRRRRG